MPQALGAQCGHDGRHDSPRRGPVSSASDRFQPFCALAWWSAPNDPSGPSAATAAGRRRRGGTRDATATNQGVPMIRSTTTSAALLALGITTASAGMFLTAGAAVAAPAPKGNNGTVKI